MNFQEKEHTVNLQIRLAGINIFSPFLWAKNGHFLTFNAIKNFKMQVLLEIRVLFEGKPYKKFYGAYGVSDIARKGEIKVTRDLYRVSN